MNQKQPAAAPASPEHAAAARVLGDLLELGDRQRTALAAGDDETLFAVLVEKQRRLEAGGLDALRDAAPLPPGLRRLFEELNRREARCLADATARRDALAAEIAALPTAATARGGYDAPPGGVRHRLDVGA